MAKIMIDVGHGKTPKGFDPGAVHGPSGTTEYSLNLIGATAMAEELVRLGHSAIVDTARRGLKERGLRAKGYDVLISFHHNAVKEGTKAQYTTARFHATKGTNADKRAAMAVNTAMAKELGLPDKGALPMALGVLSGAKDARVPYAFLVEPYFVHPQTPNNPHPEEMKGWTTRAAIAGARGLHEFLKAQ